MMLVALLSVRDGMVHGAPALLSAAALLGGLAGVLLYRGYTRTYYDDSTDDVIAAPCRHLASVTCLLVAIVALLHAVDVLARMRHL